MPTSIRPKGSRSAASFPAPGGIHVAAAGDLNGDGFGDVAIGADGHDGGGADAGMVYVILGRAAGFAAVDLADLDAADGFTIQGEAAGDRLGLQVAGAETSTPTAMTTSFSAPSATRTGPMPSGLCDLRPASGFGPIDLASLDPADGFRIEGASAGTRPASASPGPGTSTATGSTTF